MHPETRRTGIDIRPINIENPEFAGKFNIVDYGPEGTITSPQVLAVLDRHQLAALGRLAQTLTAPSSYQPDRSVVQVATDEYRDLWAHARAEDLKPSDADHEELTAHQFTLSAGGPGSDLTILADSAGDAREGFFNYYEPSGGHIIAIGAGDAQRFLDQLNND